MITNTKFALALAIAAVSAGSGYAQAPAPGSGLARFQQLTGADVSVASSLDEGAAVPAYEPGTSRKDYLDSVAAGLGAIWRKTWVVSPAGPGRPLANASYLRGIVEAPGTVSFDVQSVSAVVAIQTVAKADNASVEFAGGTPTGSVSLNVRALPVADAIAEISARTGTSWSLRYRFAPRPRINVAEEQNTARPKGRQTGMQTALEQLEAPVLIHFKFPGDYYLSSAPVQEWTDSSLGAGLGFGGLTITGPPPVTILTDPLATPVIINSGGTLSIPQAGPGGTVNPLAAENVPQKTFVPAAGSGVTVVTPNP